MILESIRKKEKRIPIMIHGIAHVALYTDKFDKTIQFYKDAFDAAELGYFKTGRNGCWLKLGESILEIFESEELSNVGCFKHIALQCDHVDESYQKALSAGAAAYVEPKDMHLNLNETKKLRIAFVKGINGEQIELCGNI